MHPHDLDPDLMPWSPEAESSVLGSLLLDNRAWDRVGDVLQAKHFYQPSHGVIFTAIAALLAGNKPADLYTVLDELQRAGKAEAVGGLAYLNSLAQQVTSAGNARRYAEIVAERALMRGIQEGAEKVKALALAPGLTAAERLDQAVSHLRQRDTVDGPGAGRGRRARCPRDPDRNSGAGPDDWRRPEGRQAGDHRRPPVHREIVAC
jgi:replicative DNA helicase